MFLFVCVFVCVIMCFLQFKTLQSFRRMLQHSFAVKLQKCFLLTMKLELTFRQHTSEIMT